MIGRSAGKELRNRFSAWQQCRRVANKKPILVYQMGKVGSSTVVRTAESLDLSFPVLHVHTLDKDHIERALNVNAQLPNFAVPQHLFVSRKLNKVISDGEFPCFIVTLTRDPISRAISFLFEDWRKKAPKAKKHGELDFMLMTEALERMLSVRNGHSDPSVWFDQELKNVFGIDVFSHPYDFDKGYIILRKEPIQTLLIRMEDLRSSLPMGLGELLDIAPESVDLCMANRASDSWYSASYKNFKAEYRVPSSLLEKMLRTKYAKHFYGPDISKLMDHWSDKSS